MDGFRLIIRTRAPALSAARSFSGQWHTPLVAISLNRVQMETGSYGVYAQAAGLVKGAGAFKVIVDTYRPPDCLNSAIVRCWPSMTLALSLVNMHV